MKKRIAIAAALAVLALASIPVINSLTSRSEAIEDAASGKITGSLPLPATELASAAASETSTPAAALPSLPAGPDTAATPGVAALPKLMVEASTRPLAQPAATNNVRATPAAAVQDKPKTAASSSALPPASSPETAQPAVKALSSTPVAPPRPQGSSFGYSVQLGLFSSVGNAEKLIQELKARGVSAKSETRVQLGPFNTRTEAEDAMTRLRELGYHPLLVPLGQ